MRKLKIVPNEYYHIYNRGNNKQGIFVDDKDWSRFLFLILYLQSPFVFYNIGRYINNFVRHRVFNISNRLLDKIIQNKTVELVNFAQMPNHFHLIVEEAIEGGISRYMQRIQDSYTKYFNTKYEKTGHLFQGPFQIVHIKDNEQLLHLSAYIHRNPREITQWKDKEHQFEWSSYQDCIGKNRWGEFIKPQIILEQFTTSEEYKDFVDTSGTKVILDKELLLDY